MMDLERLSFRNMVRFYSEELREIEKTGSLNNRYRARVFRKKGLIILKFEGGPGGKRNVLTDRCRRVLQRR